MIKRAAQIALNIIDEKLFVPSHFNARLRLGRPHGRAPSCGSLEEHLRCAAGWLRRAHRAVEQQGVSARYTFKSGWLSSYPETTGYIIPTLFNYSRFSNDPYFRDMAFKLADWLIDVQVQSGGFPGGHLDQQKEPVVFNTGQILIGLLSAYRESSDKRYLDSAYRAGQWLESVQDDDGAWRKNTYKERLHAYHTRVAWPLADVGLLCGEDSFVKAARANLDFTMTLQEDNGWFNENTLDEEDIPFTHTLAYVARGLLEGGFLLGDRRYVESAKKLAVRLLEDFESRGFLAGQYDMGYSPRACFSCLTGNAQISIIWLKLSYLDKKLRKRLLDSAHKINCQVMHCQDLYSANAGIRGAVPGSWPIRGFYIRYGYPNWAVKFLMDALMLEKEVKASISQP